MSIGTQAQFRVQVRKIYIQSFSKDAGKMFGSLYRSSKYMTPTAITYLYKTKNNGVLLPDLDWS